MWVLPNPLRAMGAPGPHPTVTPCPGRAPSTPATIPAVHRVSGSTEHHSPGSSPRTNLLSQAWSSTRHIKTEREPLSTPWSRQGLRPGASRSRFLQLPGLMKSSHSSLPHPFPTGLPPSRGRRRGRAAAACGNGHLCSSSCSLKKSLLASVPQAVILKMAVNVKNWHIVVQQDNF